tara:strand:- start:401 stop:778 length:378 start_codon:yes stop_codon:yes gene_type:complete
MKQDTIQFYSYPEGIADSMGQDEFVLVRNALGSLDTKFVGDLVTGDYYCQRIPEPMPPRNADDILKYIVKNELSFNWILKDAGRGEGWARLLEVVGRNDEPIVQVDVTDNCIRTAVEPLMDMEEL